jgi:hypothetical protein
MSGTYEMNKYGYFWYIPDPEPLTIEPYQRQFPVADDFSWWVDPYPEPHLSSVEPSEPLTEEQYGAILSVLNGQTLEEWKASRQADGKPISPIGEEKQD